MNADPVGPPPLLQKQVEWRKRGSEKNEKEGDEEKSRFGLRLPAVMSKKWEV